MAVKKKQGKYYNEKDYTYYKAKFEVWNAGDRRALNEATGRMKKISEKLKFEQCYDKNSDKRKQLPRYFFVAVTGEVLSFRDQSVDYPTLIDPGVWWTNGRPYLEINESKKKSRGRKSLSLYNLTALVFGSPVFGKVAKTALSEKGYMAIGTAATDVAGHHIIPYIDEGSPLNTDPKNIILTSNAIHKNLLDAKIPGIDAPEKDHKKFMKKISTILSTEIDEENVLISGSSKINSAGEIINDGKTAISYLEPNNDIVFFWGYNLLPKEIRKKYGADFWKEIRTKVLEQDSPILIFLQELNHLIIAAKPTNEHLATIYHCEKFLEKAGDPTFLLIKQLREKHVITETSE